jgi:hypothetical protein
MNKGFFNVTAREQPLLTAPQGTSWKFSAEKIAIKDKYAQHRLYYVLYHSMSLLNVDYKI